MSTNIDSVTARAAELDAQQRRSRHARVDRAFAFLLIIQWLAGIAAALWLSPYAWAGKEKVLHVHVWVAVLGGAGITLLRGHAGLNSGRADVIRIANGGSGPGTHPVFGCAIATHKEAP